MSVVMPVAPAVASPSRGGGGIRRALDAFLRLLWIELRRSQGYWLLPSMVGLGIVAGFENSQDGVVLWTEMSFATLRSYAIIGPLAAALAAWLMGRDRRRTLEGLIDSLPGDGLQRDLLTMLAASFWGLAGYGLVGLWFGWKGLTQATWGGPDVGLILTGALTIVAFAGIGTLMGRFIPGRFAAIIALAFTFLLTIGSDAVKQTTSHFGPNGEFYGYSIEQPLSLLMPWGLTTHNWGGVFTPVAHVRESLLWHLALLAVLVVAVTLARKRGVATYGLLTVSLAAAVITAIPLVQQNPQDMATHGITVNWTCDSASGVEVCLHPAYSAQLEGTLALHETVIGPIAGLEGVPGRWVQSGPWMAEFDPDDGMIGGFGVSQVRNLAEQIFPMTFPTGAESGEGPATGPPVWRASQVVILRWLLEPASTSTPGSANADNLTMGVIAFDPAEASEEEIRAAINRFAALTPEDQRTWLEANWAELRAGNLTLADVP